MGPRPSVHASRYTEPLKEALVNVDDIVRARIEAARRKAAAEKEARAAFAAARSKGLARRHAAKLRHLAQTDPDMTKAPEHANPGASDPPPTTRPISETTGSTDNDRPRL